jgi:hypothetical protein
MSDEWSGTPCSERVKSECSGLRDMVAARTKREELQGVCRAAKTPGGVAVIRTHDSDISGVRLTATARRTSLPTTNERDLFP